MEKFEQSLVALIIVFNFFLHSIGSTVDDKSDDFDSKRKSNSFSNDLNGDDNYVDFFLFTRETVNSPEVVDSRQITKFKTLKPGKPLKVLIHGWKGSRTCKFFALMRTALLPSSDINLIAVDWSRHGAWSSMYPSARAHVPEVGRIIADFLNFLATKQNISFADTHLIGHSLGAHVAGIAGRLMNGTISRITGSDPAGPLFSDNDIEGRLSTYSAEFVDIIHTSANYLGFGDPIGHVDFFPNGGHAAQPGCGFDFKGSCSHKRAFHFLQESIKNSTAFIAVACSSWNDFKKNSCPKDNYVIMGEHVPHKARGVFFLQTNKKAPFGRGFDGATYSRH